MEQSYSKHHVTHAHHTGLIIGTLIGSMTITVLIAASAIVSNPSYLLKPYNLLTAITLKSEDQRPVELGQAAKANSDKTIESQSTYGDTANSILKANGR